MSAVQSFLLYLYMAGCALTFITGSLPLFSLWAAAPLLLLGLASLGQLLMHRIHFRMHSKEPVVYR